MQVKDEEVMNLIDTIGEHYRTNIGNRYVRSAFRILPIDQTTWSTIEALTEKSEYYQLQGYHFDELYDRIIAMGEFIYHARNELQPQLRGLLGGYSREPGSSGNERLLRDMAVSNFGSNLAILADMINSLYARTVELDMEAHRHSRPVYLGISKLAELGRYLVPG